MPSITCILHISIGTGVNSASRHGRHGTATELQENDNPVIDYSLRLATFQQAWQSW